MWENIREIISLVSDFLGIGSVVVSIFLYFMVKKFAKKTYAQIREFDKQQQEIIKALVTLHKSLLSDRIRDDKTISRLRQLLFQIKITFSELLKKDELALLDEMLGLIKNEDISDKDFTELREKLDFIIAFFRSKKYE